MPAGLSVIPIESSPLKNLLVVQVCFLSPEVFSSYVGRERKNGDQMGNLKTQQEKLAVVILSCELKSTSAVSWSKLLQSL